MLDLRFVAPDLRRLDEVSAEVVVACIYEDERPFGGLAGLLDWRMSGRLSRLARQGFLVGSVGEVLALPARPRLSFDKLLVAGLGPRGAFADNVFERVLARVLDALVGLSVKKAVVELPGRGGSHFDVERAADILLDLARDDVHDALALVEDGDGQRRIEKRALERRRSALRAQSQEAGSRLR
jgi:hypothetical protein